MGGEKEAGNVSTSTALYRKFKDSSSTVKWLTKNIEYFSGFEDEYDSRGQLRFRDEDKGRGFWLELGGGFRTVPQGLMSLEYSRLQIIQTQEDKYKDKAAAYLADGNYKMALETTRLFNSLHPNMAFRISDLKRRFDLKKQAQIETSYERYLGRVSKSAQRQVARENQ